MAEAGTVDTAAGVAVEENAARTAAEIAAIVRSATASLPFGTDPGSFLALLEDLADEPRQAGDGR